MSVCMGIRPCCGPNTTEDEKCELEMGKLREAISHLDHSLETKTDEDWGCEECKNEHIQLREWLVELYNRRNLEQTISQLNHLLYDGDFIMGISEKAQSLAPEEVESLRDSCDDKIRLCRRLKTVLGIESRLLRTYQILRDNLGKVVKATNIPSGDVICGRLLVTDDFYPEICIRPFKKSGGFSLNVRYLYYPEDYKIEVLEGNNATR